VRIITKKRVVARVLVSRHRRRVVGGSVPVHRRKSFSVDCCGGHHTKLYVGSELANREGIENGAPADAVDMIASALSYLD
jgi:hypothetical protein